MLLARTFLQSLRRLHTVNVGGNPALELAAVHSWTSSVKQLGIDIFAAAHGHQVLGSMAGWAVG